jgi:hypothetical protein
MKDSKGKTNNLEENVEFNSIAVTILNGELIHHCDWWQEFAGRRSSSSERRCCDPLLAPVLKCTNCPYSHEKC